MPKADSPVANMKTRLALIAVVLAVAAVAFVIIRYPPPKPTAVRKPRPAAASPAGTPRAVVVAYLQALERKDFPAAYKYLSVRSREVHPYQEFAAQCENSAGPSYDLAAAREVPPVPEAPVTRDQAAVVVPLVEDPAEPSFTTVMEDNEWKVVFIGGVPWSPYP